MRAQFIAELLRLKLLRVTLLIVFSLAYPALSSAAESVKPIPIAVKVEAEGGSKGQGMWTQAANDLAPGELKTLESLVLSEIKKQEGIKVVAADYPDDFIAVVVVAAKIPNGAGREWYIASSVIVVATSKGADELLTHDVVAESDLASLARSVGAQFAAIRFRAAFGLLK